MTVEADTARCVLRRVLGRVAPEVDLDVLDPDAQLTEAGGLDSIDFIALLAALREETGIDVPIRDYPAVSTAAGFVRYVTARRGRGRRDARPDGTP